MCMTAEIGDHDVLAFDSIWVSVCIFGDIWHLVGNGGGGTLKVKI